MYKRLVLIDMGLFDKNFLGISDAHEFGGAGTEGSECELRLGAYGVPINKDTRIEFYKHNKTKRVLMWWVTFHTGYVYICICIFICMYSYMLVYIHTHTHTHIYMYMCAHRHTNI